MVTLKLQGLEGYTNRTRHLIRINSSLLLHWWVHRCVRTHPMLSRSTWWHSTHRSSTWIHWLTLKQEVTNTSTCIQAGFLKAQWEKLKNSSPKNLLAAVGGQMAHRFLGELSFNFSETRVPWSTIILNSKQWLVSLRARAGNFRKLLWATLRYFHTKQKKNRTKRSSLLHNSSPTNFIIR